MVKLPSALVGMEIVITFAMITTTNEIKSIKTNL